MGSQVVLKGWTGGEERGPRRDVDMTFQHSFSCVCAGATD